MLYLSGDSLVNLSMMGSARAEIINTGLNSLAIGGGVRMVGVGGNLRWGGDVGRGYRGRGEYGGVGGDLRVELGM